MNENLDVEYFNQFQKGYFPYSDKDVDVLVEDLIIVINTKLKSAPIISEIGCGSGQFSKELKSRINSDIEFYGVDIAKTILEHYPYNKIYANAFKIPLENSFFDIICYPASLHHLFPLEKSLSEMNRLMKKGGYFYCIEPNLFHPHRLFFMNFSRIYTKIKKIDDVPINPFKLKRNLKKMGFRITSYSLVNLEFKNPGILQRFQNKLAKSFLGKIFPIFINPWFVLIAKKE